MKQKQPFELHQGFYKPDEIKDVLQKGVSCKDLLGNNKGEYFYNIPCAFDIETTSFYTDNKGNTYTQEECEQSDSLLEKVSIMYIWQLGINGFVIIGRTWEEYIKVIETIKNVLSLDSKHRLIIYVHNLSYEFQFLRKHFQWEKVFAMDTRKPIYATSQGIEYRCSYILSGYSLAKLSDQLTRYKIQKLVGDLDYSLMRHSETPLADKELQYCINDVLVVMAWIQEKIEENNNKITSLPLTKTGFVRKACRNKCLYTTNKNGKHVFNGEYLHLMEELTIEVDELKELQRAFQGGFAHANAYYVGQICEDVTSYDFTSSYPYVMCSDYFPMSKGMKIDTNKLSQKQLMYFMQNYCCLMSVTYEKLSPKIEQDNPLSQSRCYQLLNPIINNGRVACADLASTTITELDFMIYHDFYNYQAITVHTLTVYERGYLPKVFIESILDFYSDKTTLKGVQGKEIEYLKAKENVNSCYGMAVTSPIRPTFIYTNDTWETEQVETVGSIIKYNDSKSRFLFYPWGVWVTAHARYNLFTAIYNLGNDYIYSDTDSVKLFNAEKHKDYFEKYNTQVNDKLHKMCEHYNIDFERTRPKTIKGIKKPLGIWDFDGHYKQFKTLGAKRYIVQYDNDTINITVSGLNKQVCVPYLLDKYKDVQGVFNAFNDMLYIPCDHTGKNIHSYIDDTKRGVLYDYLNQPYNYCELSGVHLAPCDYSLSLTDAFLNFIKGVQYE